ncbi:MAG: XdhC family protein, partial [Thermoplasmata archaeon]
AALRDRGVSRDAIERVRSPVGIEIGAQSPAEIAISIVAELVQGMHPATGAPASRPRAALPTEGDVVARTP